jgi:hypothetical protein
MTPAWRPGRLERTGTDGFQPGDGQIIGFAVGTHDLGPVPSEPMASGLRPRKGQLARQRTARGWAARYAAKSLSVETLV